MVNHVLGFFFVFSFKEQFLIDQSSVSLRISEQINHEREASDPGPVHPPSSSGSLHAKVNSLISSVTRFAILRGLFFWSQALR